MSTENIFTLVAFAFGLLGAGMFLHKMFLKLRLTTYQSLAAEMIRNAENEIAKRQQEALIERKNQELSLQKEIERQSQQEKKKLLQEEERLKSREDRLDQRMSLVEKKLSEIERKEIALAQLQQKIVSTSEENEKNEKFLVCELEKISQMTSQEAKECLLDLIKKEMHHESSQIIRKTIQEAQEHADKEATRIITCAIQRLAVPCVNETTINTVALPSEELKGRIIGREGRNIRALERATGVTFLIDDTPGAIVISCHDPIRLHTAKLAIEDLFQDGRVHPTRIEEAVEKAQNSIQKIIKKNGEEAVAKAGILYPHPEIIDLLGKLKFRYSFGQNVLDHSLEVAYLMGMMAAELGLDVTVAKRIGLFHDIGKATSHENENSHALIGRDIALRCGESPDVANGIGCHHGEIPPTSVEGSLCGAADAISASRQGARSESLDQYIKRLKKLEEIAYSFEGVEKAYVIQAGRELKVIVLPEKFDDNEVVNLARVLTKKIEKEVNFSGKIKITVIREKKAVEYAL